MRGKHVKIELSETERTELDKFIKTGKRSVKLVNRARVILELDEANGRKPLTQAQIAPKITGEVEAHIIALACSPVPEGCAKWAVRLLADKCVELNYIDSISFKSVQRVLKKHNLSLT